MSTDRNQQAWVSLLTELIHGGVVHVPRSLHPLLPSSSPPEVFCFFNRTTDAYGTCLYLRWKVADSPPAYSVHKVAAKTKVTAQRGSTTPVS